MISKKMIFVSEIPKESKRIKTRWFLFMLILMLSVNNSFGAEISMTNPQALCKWVAPDGFTSTDPNSYENVVAVGWNNNISIIYYPYTSYGSGTSDIFIGATGQTVEDMIFTKDYLFVAYNNGQVYRVNQWFGLFDWSTDADIGVNTILITTVSTTQGTINMAVDESGFIYVSGGTYVYKINPDTLTTTASTNTAQPIYSLSIGSNNMFAGTRVGTTSTTLANYYSFPGLSSYSTITYTGTSKGTSSASLQRHIYGIQELSNGNFAILRIDAQYSGTVYSSVEYGNSTNVISNLDLIEHGDTVDWEDADLQVMTNGICIIALQSTDKLYTYELVSGGIDFSGGIYVPAKLVYDTSDIYTDYQNYYNGSTVNTHYSLSFDLDDQETEFYSKDVIGNRFNWKIELIDPNGVLVNSYNIPENFDRESILSNTWFITSSIAFSSISPNGTYDLNIFEIDTNTNEKSLLDSTSFTILYEGTTGNTGIEETDSTNIVTTIISSVYFQAFILIMTCALAGGSVAGGAGLGGGGLIATVSCVFLGLLPYSFAFIIAIVCCAVVALAVADKIGGGG